MALVIDRNQPREVYILDVIYEVKTVEEALRSAAQVEIFGTPSTGFAQYDNQLVGSFTFCALNIDKMAKIHERGYYIGLVREEEAKDVYESVQHYLTGWMEAVGPGINHLKMPYDMLHRLDRFAHIVYPSAAAHYRNDGTLLSPFYTFCEDLLGSTGLGELKIATKPQEEQPVIARKSLQEELLAHQARMLR